MARGSWSLPNSSPKTVFVSKGGQDTLVVITNLGPDDVNCGIEPPGTGSTLTPIKKGESAAAVVTNQALQISTNGTAYGTFEIELSNS